MELVWETGTAPRPPGFKLCARQAQPSGCQDLRLRNGQPWRADYGLSPYDRNPTCSDHSLSSRFVDVRTGNSLNQCQWTDRKKPKEGLNAKQACCTCGGGTTAGEVLFPMFPRRSLSHRRSLSLAENEESKNQKKKYQPKNLRTNLRVGRQ